MRRVDDARTVDVGGEGEEGVGSVGEVAVVCTCVGMVSEGSVGCVAVVKGQVVGVGDGIVEERAKEGWAGARFGWGLVGQDGEAAHLSEDCCGLVCGIKQGRVDLAERGAMGAGGVMLSEDGIDGT